MKKINFLSDLEDAEQDEIVEKWRIINYHHSQVVTLPASCENVLL
jgi:hypothetical protein